MVRVATVGPAGAVERSFTGIIAARVQSDLGFRVPGKVIERLVDVGQSVRAGQPLLRIDPKDLTLAIEAKEKTVVAARALAVQAAADEPRYRKLLADGWVTQQKYDQIKATLDSARAQLAAAEAQAQVARNEGGYALLLADADAIVVETFVEPGQVVAAGQSVVKLAHAGPREAAVNLPEAMRPPIGSSATAKLYGVASKLSGARLRQLSDAADPSSRTYEARYVLEGDAAQAPIGATVRVSIANEAAAEASEIPIGALYDDGKATWVWIVDRADNSVTQRAVRVQRLTDETVFVRGLEQGELVVALGAHLLHPGDHVRVEKEQTATQ